MHRHAVVPHDQIPLPPYVGVDEAALCRMLVQITQIGPASGVGQPSMAPAWLDR